MGEDEELEGAIATDNDNYGKYPNNACQQWKIKTSPSKVKVLLICLNNPPLLQSLYPGFQFEHPLHIVLQCKQTSHILCQYEQYYNCVSVLTISEMCFIVNNL